MKKIAIVSVLFLLISCGNNTDIQTQNTNNQDINTLDELTSSEKGGSGSGGTSVSRK